MLGGDSNLWSFTGTSDWFFFELGWSTLSVVWLAFFTGCSQVEINRSDISLRQENKMESVNFG